jgi:FKBP-type peptidyl-prolyl cis-trans isomerase
MIRQIRTRVAAPVVVLACVAMLAGAPASAQTPEAEDEQVIYYIGALLGRQASSLFLVREAERELIKRGFADALDEKTIEIDEKAMQGRLQTLQRDRQAEATSLEKEAAATFVAEAATREGAVRSDSGLVYLETTAGDGASPTPTDNVKVHYHGTLRDGSVFDSSVERGSPHDFKLNRVIPCWTEALQLMKAGGKASIVCPPDIAYGDRGAPPTIPGGAALNFEVELIEVSE